MLELVETVVVKANCCKCGKSKDFWVFGNLTQCSVNASQNRLILRKDIRTNTGISHVVMVECKNCHRLTVHLPVRQKDIWNFSLVAPYKGNWKTIKPRGWRRNVRFIWPDEEFLDISKRDLMNCIAIKISLPKQASSFWTIRFLHSPRNNFRRSYLCGIAFDMFNSYIKGDYKEFRKGYSEYKNRAAGELIEDVQLELNRLHNLKQEKEVLSLAVERAIITLYQARHISKSVKLKEIRENLQQALTRVGMPLPKLEESEPIKKADVLIAETSGSGTGE